MPPKAKAKQSIVEYSDAYSSSGVKLARRRHPQADGRQSVVAGAPPEGESSLPPLARPGGSPTPGSPPPARPQGAQSAQLMRSPDGSGHLGRSGAPPSPGSPPVLGCQHRAQPAQLAGSPGGSGLVVRGRASPSPSSSPGLRSIRTQPEPLTRSPGGSVALSRGGASPTPGSTAAPRHLTRSPGGSSALSRGGASPTPGSTAAPRHLMRSPVVGSSLGRHGGSPMPGSPAPPRHPHAQLPQPGSPGAGGTLGSTIALFSKHAVDTVFTMAPRPKTALNSAVTAAASSASQHLLALSHEAAGEHERGRLQHSGREAAAAGAGAEPSASNSPGSPRSPPHRPAASGGHGSPSTPRAAGLAAAAAAAAARATADASSPRSAGAISPRVALAAAAAAAAAAGGGGSPRSWPMTSSQSQPADVYEALKRAQPAEVQQQIELEEVFWDAQELQERRKDLQQRLKDEEMLERIKRRVAGEKINLPSVPVPKLLSKLLTPRGGQGGGQGPGSPGSGRSPRSPAGLSSADGRSAPPSLPLSARSDEGRPVLLGGGPLLPSEGQPSTESSDSTVRMFQNIRSQYAAHSARTSYAARTSLGGGRTSLNGGRVSLNGGRTSLNGGRTSLGRNSLGLGRNSLGGRDSRVRESWLAYYHSGSAAQAPAWRVKVQQWCQAVVQHPDFGLVVTLLIALNCVSLALYQPVLPDGEGLNQKLKLMEMGINFAFTVEVALTCVAAGGVKEYLRSPWNLFDLAMVLVGYTDFIPAGDSASGVRALRALRALRPLRTITRFESLRSIVVCFLEAVPLLVNVVQLLVFFLVLFAITGTLLFMDSFQRACLNNATGLKEDYGDANDYGCGTRQCPANYTCSRWNADPVTNTMGFGNMGESMLTTFQVITVSTWAYTMYIVMDSSGIAASLFFLAVVLIQAYFVVHLFLAVLKNKFAKAQELYSKVSNSETKQRSTFVVLWRRLTDRMAGAMARRREVDALRMSERSARGTTGFSTPTSLKESAQALQARQPSLRIPQTRWQWAMYYLRSYWFEIRWHLRQVVEHPGFDYLFLSCIVANTVLLAMTRADMSPSFAASIDQGSRVLTIIFIVEAALKVMALGVWGYMSDPFNNFDFVIALLGMVELVIAMGSNGTALRSFRTLRILRSLRVLRVLKVFRYLQSLRVITDVLLSSMGAFLAIASLMVLFIFVFAVVGLQIFGHATLDPDFPNFHNIWNAIVLVFQTVTLENWGQMMFSVTAASGWASSLYFVTWVMLGKWTLLTLFLAITLSAFEANYEKYTTRGPATGGVNQALLFFRGLGDRLCHPFRRRKAPRGIAPTLSFNSTGSLGSAPSADGPPLPAPRRKLQRSPTGFVRAPAVGGFGDLLAGISSCEEEEDGERGRAAGGEKALLGPEVAAFALAKAEAAAAVAAGGAAAAGAGPAAALAAKQQRQLVGSPVAEVKLKVDRSTEEREVIAAAAGGGRGAKAAVGSALLQRSPADLLLTVSGGTDDREAALPAEKAPTAPQLAAAGAAATAKAGASPAPAVVLTLDPSTEESEPPESDSPLAQRVKAAMAAAVVGRGQQGSPLRPPLADPLRRSMELSPEGLIPAVRAVHLPRGTGSSSGDSAPAAEDAAGAAGGEVGAVDAALRAELAAPRGSLSVPRGHVGSLVKQFEESSPQAQRQLTQASSLPRSALAGSRAAQGAGSREGWEKLAEEDDDTASIKSDTAAAGGKARGRKRGSRHARFAVPDDKSEEEDRSPAREFRGSLDPAEAAADAVAAAVATGKTDGGVTRQPRRSLTPAHRAAGGPTMRRTGSGPLGGSGSGGEGSEGAFSASDSEASSGHGAGHGAFLGGFGSFNRRGQRGRTNSDSTVPSDLLLEAERESDLSGGSSLTMSSAGSARRLARRPTLSRIATLGRVATLASKAARKRSKRKDFPPLEGRSMFFFEVDSPLRAYLYQLVTLQYFDYAMMLVVLLSCVEMAMETPNMDPNSLKTKAMHWVDVGTTIIFWLEAVLKILAFSFKAYIHYFTNKVDFIVVLISTIVLIAESLNARFLKALRVLRAVRPLRVLTRSVSMLLVFHTLARSLMEMGNVTVLCALCFLIFAILGVQLFAGLFWSCNDPSVAGKAECVGTFIDPDTCLETLRQWTNLPYNFDDIGNAFLTLFITATLDGYTPSMYMSMSTRPEQGLQPRMGASSAAFLFWFFYITLVAFFVLNLYVGVVFYQFQRLKMLSQTGSAVLTASQTGYVEMMKAVFRLKPLDKAPLPPNPLRRLCHRIAYHPWFDGAMTAVIVANIILLATTYYGEPASFTQAKEYANTAFSATIILECLVKFTAMGPRLFWRSSWNKFDLALTFAALVDILTQVLNTLLGGVVKLSTIRKTMMLLRTLRMFKLMRKFKGIQSLMTTLIISLPAIFNVGALLLLFFFIYSYMGVLLLGNVRLQSHLNPHANFRTFPNAMLTLFRVATGDDWAGIFEDCMVKPPYCDPALGNCGSKYIWLYFFTFYLAVGLIAFNLFTTVILETFERIQDTESWRITPASLDEFCELWAEYDDGTSLIDPKDLEAILMRLPPPMGLGAKASGVDVVRFLFALDIPLVDGKVPFYRTAFELVKKGAQAEIPPGELKRKLDRMIRRFLNKHAVAEESEHMSFSVACTVVRIQRHWRGLVAKRKEEAALAAARAARRAAGLPSDEEEEVPEAVEEALQEEVSGLRAAVRRASTVLVNIRNSVKRGSSKADVLAALKRARPSVAAAVAKSAAGPGGRPARYTAPAVAHRPPALSSGPQQPSAAPAGAGAGAAAAAVSGARQARATAPPVANRPPALSLQQHSAAAAGEAAQPAAAGQRRHSSAAGHSRPSLAVLAQLKATVAAASEQPAGD